MATKELCLFYAESDISTDNNPPEEVALHNPEHTPSERIEGSRAYPKVFQNLVAAANRQDAAIPQATPI